MADDVIYQDTINGKTYRVVRLETGIQVECWTPIPTFGATAGCWDGDASPRISELMLKRALEKFLNNRG